MSSTETGTIDIDPDGDLILVISFRPREDAQATLSEPDMEQGAESSNTAWNLSTKEPSSKLRCKVSLKHLILACGYFKECLKKFRPGRSNHQVFKISLSYCNPEALLIVLNIMHGYNRRVPRSVNIELLLSLAEVVEKLKCHEVVDVFASIWIQHAKDEQGPHSEQVSWVLISWVFRDDDTFKKATMYCQQYGRSIPDRICRDLPILGRIRDDITNSEESVSDELFSLLDLRFNTFCDTEIQCCPSCDAMCLGLLVKHRTAKGIHNIDIGDFSPVWMYNCIGDFEYSNFQCPIGMACTNIRWFDDMRVKADNIYNTLQGLDLDDYLE